MKIVLEDVSPKHYLWLKNMEEALSFKIKEVDTTKEEDEALVRAIEAGRGDDAEWIKMLLILMIPLASRFEELQRVLQSRQISFQSVIG